MELGRFGLKFCFLNEDLNEESTEISVYGLAEIYNERGRHLASWKPDILWSSLIFQKLLDSKVDLYSVPTTKLLEIVFNTGYKLKLHDNSDNYETMMISYITKRGKSPVIV